MTRQGLTTKFLTLALLLALPACGGSGSSPSMPAGHSDPVIRELPDPSQGLPSPAESGLLVSTPLERGTSDIEGNAAGWTQNIYGEGSGTQDGNALVIDTEAGTRVSALYSLVFADGTIYEKQVPYLYPYEISINTDNGGPVYVMLPDYGNNRWEVYDSAPQQGSTITIPAGLTGNHGNVSGSIVFGLIAWDGSDLRVESIDLLLPDIPAPGNPVEYHQFIEAADGTLLATDIYLPYAETNPFVPDPPYPAAIVRTPYSKDFIDLSLIKPLTDVNVVVMVQYFRGRLADSGAWPDSGGTEGLFDDHAGPEHFDAVDTVDWLQARHWSNDLCIASGPSALGLWIYQAAPELGDKLTGFFPIVSSGNVAEWALVENGVLKQSNVEIFLQGNAYPAELLQDVIANFADTAFTDQFDFDSRADEVTAPAFHETGWWDVDVDSTIGSWRALNKNGGTGAAGNQWLVIGPWTHDSVRTMTSGSLSFPDSPRHDPSKLPTLDPGYTWDGLQWLPNLFLPGGFTLIDPPENKVLAYFIGEEGDTTLPANTWYEFADWPPAYTDLELFLQDGGGLGETAEGAASEHAFRMDPANPIQTLGGAMLPGLYDLEPFPAGPYDQAPLVPNDDILEYRGEPLASQLSIAGPVLARMFVSTDAIDTDVCVKLIDEYPDGTQLLVSDGIMRLSHMDPSDHSGGETVATEWNIGSRAYVFGAGHRVVVHVQGSNFPRYNPNPGNGEDYFDRFNPDGSIVQNNLLHIGDQSASSIVLPVFDPEA